MSRSLPDHQLEQQFSTRLTDLGRHSRRERALQPQGTAALRIEQITGYQYFDVPSGTIVPNFAFIDLESGNANDIMIATLLHSTFMHFTDGTYINADLEDHDIEDDFWNVWLAYDTRDTPADLSLAYTPSDTLMDRVAGELDDFALPHHQARIGLRVNRHTSTAKPATTDQYLITYHIRAVIG